MPIEIRELVIKTSIQESVGGKPATGGDQLSDREEIIADCVEQVTAMLREQEER